MKVFLIALFVCVATIANAQTKKFNWYSTESMDAMGVTPEQQQKVKDLIDSYKPKTAAVNNDASLSAEEKKAKVKELNIERGRLYYQIITKEQRAKGVAIRKAQRDNM